MITYFPGDVDIGLLDHLLDLYSFVEYTGVDMCQSVLDQFQASVRNHSLFDGKVKFVFLTMSEEALRKAEVIIYLCVLYPE